MVNQQQNQNQEYNFKKGLKQDLGYEYIEIEFILQDSSILEKNQDEDRKEDALGAKLSRKELRKEPKNRIKSWIEIEHRINEYLIAESRTWHQI